MRISAGKSLGLSDLSGVIVVPPGAATLRLLDIRQGSQSLARVPIVPGLAAEVRLALADDRQRLAIETALQEAEDALIDLAARRQALAARIKLAKKAGDAGADRLLPKLRGLASVESQQALISQAEKALAAADPRAQALSAAQARCTQKAGPKPRRPVASIAAGRAEANRCQAAGSQAG